MFRWHYDPVLMSEELLLNFIGVVKKIFVIKVRDQPGFSNSFVFGLGAKCTVNTAIKLPFIHFLKLTLSRFLKLPIFLMPKIIVNCRITVASSSHFK